MTDPPPYLFKENMVPQLGETADPELHCMMSIAYAVRLCPGAATKGEEHSARVSQLKLRVEHAEVVGEERWEKAQPRTIRWTMSPRLGTFVAVHEAELRLR